jgi:hypothetical protein
MRLPSKPKPLITMSELSARLELPAIRMSRLIRRGVVRPDYICDSAILFRPSSVKHIAAQLLRP